MSPNLLKELEKLEEIKQAEKQTTEKEVEVEDEVADETVFAQKNLLKEYTPLYAPKQEQPKKEELKTVNLFSASAFAEVEQPKNIEPLVPKTTVFEPEEEEEVNEVEPVKEDVFEIKPKAKPKKKFAQFRMKLFSVLFCVVLAVSAGWVITNTVRISNINKSIESAQTVYNANEVKLIKNIEKLDDLNSQNPEDDTTLIVVDDIITVQPLPLENPTDYQQTSNWFDVICNWITGLFGG